MGKLNRVIVLLTLLAACAQTPLGEQPGSSPRPERRRALAAVKPPAPDPRLDAAGELKPSEQRVSWLQIPAGFSPRPGNTPRLNAFDASNLPFAKARAYLQSRLAAEQTEYPVNGVTYHQALPTHTRLDMAKLTVRLIESDRTRGSLRLIIEDLTPSPLPPLSAENAMQALVRDRNRME